MYGPDPANPHPMEGFPQVCFIKNTVKNPNIIITGTPGVGKTTHAEQLAQATGFTHISVNQIVKDEGFHEGKDEETGSWIVDEDKVRCASKFLAHL